jgi:hemolysin III
MQLSVKEELANAISHGIAALLSIVGTIILIRYAQSIENPKLLLSFLIYGFGIIFLFSASTLYHSFSGEIIKKKLRVFDHIGIYLMIAGTYTPFMWVSVDNIWGTVILVSVWTIAAAGVLFKIFFTGRFQKLSLISYLVMGWFLVLGAKQMIDAIDSNGLWLLLAGGLSFTVGTIFYRWHSLPYHHAIWHIFVMLGGGFHYFAILYYTMPIQ